MGKEERKEPTEEEMRVMEEGRDFAVKISKEMDGKSVEEILPLDVAAVAYGCLHRVVGDSPILTMGDLMKLITLVANSVLKFDEKKREGTKALDKLWKDD